MDEIPQEQVVQAPPAPPVEVDENGIPVDMDAAPGHFSLKLQRQLEEMLRNAVQQANQGKTINSNTALGETLFEIFIFYK